MIPYIHTFSSVSLLLSTVVTPLSLFSEHPSCLFLLISRKVKVCHLYKFTFTSLAGPPSYPVVFLNTGDVSILLLLFLLSFPIWQFPYPAFHCRTLAISKLQSSSWNSEFHCILIFDQLKCLPLFPLLIFHSLLITLFFFSPHCSTFFATYPITARLCSFLLLWSCNNLELHHCSFLFHTKFESHVLTQHNCPTVPQSIIQHSSIQFCFPFPVFFIMFLA